MNFSSIPLATEDVNEENAALQPHRLVNIIELSTCPKFTGNFVGSPTTWDIWNDKGFISALSEKVKNIDEIPKVFAIAIICVTFFFLDPIGAGAVQTSKRVYKVVIGL